MSSYQRGRVSCITVDHNMSSQCLGRHHLLTSHMPPCPVCYCQQQPAFCSGEIDIETWTLDTWRLLPAGAWLVLTPSVSNISTPAHVSLTKQIFLLTPDIFTAFTAFYDVARGSSSRCLLLLEGWHVLCSANGIVSFKFVAINNHCPVSIISLHHIWSLLL